MVELLRERGLVHRATTSGAKTPLVGMAAMCGRLPRTVRREAPALGVEGI